MQSLITLDQSLATTIYHFVANQPIIRGLAIFCGVYLVYLMPLLFIFVWFAIARKVSLRAALTGILAWEGVSKIIAAVVDRPRPMESLIGVKELVFHRPDASFPSDHSSFLMAVATSFYLNKQPKLGNLVVVIAVLVGISRVGIGVHYPADILAGWLVGALTAYLIQLIDQPFDRYVLEPIIKLARRFRL